MGLVGMFIRLIMPLVELLLITVANAALTTPQAKPAADCPTPSKCGEVEIPYPFGTKPGCYLNDNFLISCNTSSDPPKPFLRNISSNIPVTNIALEGKLHITTQIAGDCNKEDMPQSDEYYSQSWISLSEFTISNKNMFTVIGCDSYAYVEGYISYNDTLRDFANRSYKTGCMSLCNSLENVKNGSCNGQGCCQIEIPQGLKHTNFSAYSFNDHANVLDFNPCTYAFIVEQSQFSFSTSYLKNLQPNRTFPMVLDWSITGKCEKARTLPEYACKANAHCYSPDNNSDGYLCNCNDGYRGNPYLANGCKDIDECEVPNLNNCTHVCENTVGNYTCRCPDGYSGDGRKDGKGCRLNNQFSVVYKVAIGIGIFFVVVVLSISWLYLVLKKRKLIRQKEKLFEQNGGYLLKQQLSIRTGSSDTAKIFTVEELKNATNNYAENRIIGRGGYGTVYKGFLKDNSTVAIKKSKVMDQSQVDQFVNEVVVLSQINHRNVVRLLGCCLETEVPLLVYEFVSNGTLCDHIHNKDRAAPTISWETRLKIAAETAGVLSYLHSAASTPIIHRDVKTTNILLDHKCTAKVSDFGASKLVPMDETQLSTMVQGTLGYLDPEYLHTSQLTEKSDVYSFGVVLVELLTGKKPILFDRPEEERSLVKYFLSSLKESRLLEIVDNRMVKDGKEDQVREVAELAKTCLRVKGEDRPPMVEVAMELEGLVRMMHKQNLCDNAELMNPEETISLLSETSESYKSAQVSNKTAGYDSTKEHVLVAFDVDGR